MSLRTTPTIAICLAAGLAGGIALARPADSDPFPAAAAEPASATADDPDASTAEPSYGYGTSDENSNGGEVDLDSDPYAGLGDAATDADVEPAPADGSGAADDPAADPAPADEPADDPAPAAAPVSIDIADFAFSGATTASPGAVLTVTNLDAAPHTVTATNVEFDTGNLGQGESATITLPTEPGTYTFFCAVHPSMTGEITIG